MHLWHTLSVKRRLERRTVQRLAGGILLAVLIALIAAPMAGPALSQTSSDARVRFVHAIEGAGAIDVYTDGQLTIQNLEAGSASLYARVPSGARQLAVTAAGETTPLWEQSVELMPNSAQTLIAETTDPAGFQIYADDLAPLPLGKTRFTAIHAMPDGSAIDVVLSDGRPVISGLTYDQTYGTLDLPVLSYDLAVVASGEAIDNAIVPVSTYSLDSGTSYSLLVWGAVDSPQTLLLAAPGIAEDGAGWVRTVHAIPGANAVDVYIDGTLAAPGLTFEKGATGYMALPPGEHTFSLRERGSADDLTSTTFPLEADQRFTIAAFGGDEGAFLQVIADETSAITESEAVVSLVNALPGEATVFLALADGSGLTGDIASGGTSTAIVEPTDDSLTVTVGMGEESADLAVPLTSIYGGVYYQLLVVAGAEGPEVLVVNPASVAQGIASAPAETTVDVSEPTEDSADAATGTPSVADSEVVFDEPTPAATTDPLGDNPRARVLLDPGANLQLRQYPSSSAFSLGRAPSGATLIVRGRAGDIQLGPLETPNPEATEFVDPVSVLEEGQDLNPVDTWVFVTYNTPDGGQIDAWVNALYLALTDAGGQPMQFRTLVTIPSNRAGESRNTSVTAGEVQTAQAEALVGGLDEGVNLQIRRTPTEEGESLILVPEGTTLQLLGMNEDQTWAFVRYRSEGSTVTGWVNALFLVEFSYQDRPIDIEGLQARNALPVIDESERGTGPGQAAAPADDEDTTSTVAEPVTTDPDTPIATIILNEGANLHLRRNPSANAESLALIPGGTSVPIDGRTPAGDWLHVEYEQREGWISTAYVTVSQNGAPYAVQRIAVFEGLLADPDAQATATAQAEIPVDESGTPIPVPTAEPTAAPRDARILSDVVAMTQEPGGDSNGLPILTRDQIVGFITTTPDGLFSYIQLSDGTAGWIPSSSILILE